MKDQDDFLVWGYLSLCFVCCIIISLNVPLDW